MTPEDRAKHILELLPLTPKANQEWFVADQLKAQALDGREDERILRELLWLNHGCGFENLYGDDGERQCSKCRIDFKRMPAEAIELKFINDNVKALGMVFLPATTQKQPPEPKPQPQ